MNFGYKLKKNLILTGMMGVGKSTIGKILSKDLNMKFVDVDKIIEKKLSSTISQIFKKKGEAYFRKIEEKESIRLINENETVIALGGGAFLNKLVRENVKKNCFSIWLDLNSDDIFKRVYSNNKRPLLNEGQYKEDLKRLYDERKKVYSLADYKIDCNFKNKEEIVQEIRNLYENS